MARKLTNGEKEINTLLDLLYDEKQCKMWTMTQRHCRTWNLLRKLKNEVNGKLTWYDLEYGYKTEETWK